MSKFNTKSVGTKTTNLAGGTAYMQSEKSELVSLVLTSFVDDKFYRDASAESIRLIALMNAVKDPLFVAKLAVYARNVYGMRSISHFMAAMLAKPLSGKDYAKAFYNAVVRRVDDMSEIIACYQSRDNKKLPAAMKKGLAKAFDKFDEYQLAKYRGEGKGVKLVDVVNMVHPIPTEKNANALAKLIKGELKSSGTWESSLSAAGSDADAKSEAWAELIKSRKIGYFALLRNLRNVILQAPELINDVHEILTDKNLIQKSLVLPFRFLTAIDEIEKMDQSKSTEIRAVMVAINTAIDICLSNVPKFDGKTLVVLDVSSSMLSARVDKTAALFAAALVKSNNCDFMEFAVDASYRTIMPLDSTMTIANKMRFQGGGTNFPAIFERAATAYDRVIILSDMQGWIQRGYSPAGTFESYKRSFNCNPFVYSFDLAGYGTVQYPESKLFLMAGFSEKTFDVMKMLEADKNAMINEVEKVDFTCQ